MPISTAAAMMWLAAASPGQLTAADPLHVRVNTLLQKTETGPISARCTDAEFLRRTALNLTGTILSAETARKFLADKSSDKRTKLVDQLLGSPEYIRHLTDFFDVTFSERRASKTVSATAWRQYLYDSVAANKPYNQLAREILTGNHADPKLAATAKFYFDRNVEANQLTRDVARIFFGRDFQCAQCHDHPIIDNYLQADYYGLYAAVNRSYLFTNKKAKKTILAERAAGTVDFKSVFTKIEGRTLPRLPGVPQHLDEPVFPQGLEYQTASVGYPAAPKYSRRARLANDATNGTNVAFNRNIANRLWRAMMGRGLVEPVDYLHPDNPPSHPELLSLLADEFALSKFDVKSFLREIALSDVYQRSFELPRQLTANVARLSQRITKLTAEQKRLTTIAAASEKLVVKVETAIEPLKAEILKIDAELAKANATIAAAIKKAAPTTAKVASLEKSLVAKRAALVAVQAVAEQTEKVVNQIPGDKELAAAFATFQKKSAAFGKDVTTLTKSLAAAKTAAKPLADKVAAVQKTAAPIVAKLTAARKKLAPLDVKLATVTAVWKRDQIALNAVDIRLEAAESSKTLTAVQQSLAASQQTKLQLAPTVAQLSKQVATLAKTMQPQLAALKQLGQQVAAAKQAVTVAENKMRDAQSVATALSAAAKQAEAVKTKLPNDADVAKAVATLKAKSLTYVKTVREAQQVVASTQANRVDVTAKLTAAQKTAKPQQTVLTQKQAELAKLTQQLSTLTAKTQAGSAALDEARNKLIEQLSHRFAIRPLQPLKPEQVVWSMMDATGYTDRIRLAEIAAYKKKNPKFVVPQDPAQRAAYERQIERAVAKKMQGNITAFVRLFGGAAGQPQDEFFATVDQALFLANGSSVRGWLSPSGTNLTARLMKLKDTQAIADELYLSVLTRPASKAEVADVGNYLKSRTKDRSTALGELAWGLLTSAEFRFNY